MFSQRWKSTSNLKDKGNPPYKKKETQSNGEKDSINGANLVNLLA